MKRLIALLFAAWLGSFAGCDRPAPQPPAPAPAPAPAPQAQVENAQAAWPFLAALAGEQGNARAFEAAEMLKRNYYFILDASASMSQIQCSGTEPKLAVAKRALEEFASKMPVDANFGGLVFDVSGIHEIMPLNRVDRGVLKGAIGGIQAGGWTPLAEAIRRGYASLTQKALEQLGYGEYHLVVVTDGEATGADPRIVVDEMIVQSPVVLHTIGFCIGTDHSLNQPGRAIYRAANNPRELAQGLSDVLAEAPAFDLATFK